MDNQLNIYNIRQLAKTQKIPPQKIVKCEKCGSVENLHLYNYPDPYGMGWGHNPSIYCETCNVQETPLMRDRGLYNPITHNEYLNAGGIYYKKLQGGGPFICYDCHQISGIGELFNWHGYSYINVNNKTEMIEFCMPCWTINHTIDAPIIDCIVHTKGEEWYLSPNKYINSNDSNEYDKQYAKYLYNSHKYILPLKQMIQNYCLSNNKKPYNAMIDEVYQTLKLNCLDNPSKNPSGDPSGDSEILQEYMWMMSTIKS